MSSTRILQATASHWVPALGLIFQHLLPADRASRVAELITAAHKDTGVLEHLLIAQRDRECLAAVWGQVMPGQTALLWGPVFMDAADAVAGNALLERLTARLAAAGVRVLQALPTSPSTAKAIAENGFTSRIDLLYLAAMVTGCPPPDVQELEFVSYQEPMRPKLRELLASTYQNTMDVPLLNGRRDLDDVIEGYMSTGTFDPARWWILRHQAQEIGCLLLADHPQRDHCELVYMGIAPAVRGRGLGEQIVAYAKWQAAAAGRTHLILAVDASNDPAIRIYSQAGFQELQRQEVRLKFL